MISSETTTESQYYPTMPYSQERLELALNLFRRTKPYLKQKGLPHEYLEKNLRSKYELRWGTIKNARNAPSTWIDDDDSGDYDPKQDVPKRKLCKSRLSQRDNAVRPAKRQKQPSIEEEPGLLVTLKLTSEAGKAFLSTLHHRTRIEQEEDSFEDAGLECSLFSSKRYSLRRRGKRDTLRDPPFNKQPSRGGGPQISTQSLLSLDLGHPAARGCKSCWEFNHECSLVDRPAVYPCQVCREDGFDCELIIQPKQKRGCENCKRKRKVVCSYLQSDADHHLPCKQCQDVGMQCLAGPARDKQIRVSNEDDMLDDEPSDDPVQNFSLPSPQRHTETIQPLPTPESLRSNSPKDWNSRTGIYAVRQPKSKESAPQDNILPEPLLATPNYQPCSSQHKKNSTLGITRMITTSFAHPINFAYEPPNNGSRPCHWCHDFRYGILGLGTLHVEVIDYGDGSGYIEIEGGHISRGHEPSRMCIICALERVHTMNCNSHTISALKGYDEKSFDYDAAYQDLLQEPGPNGEVKTTTLWCMLCPRPASHGCVTVQSVDKFQEPVDPSDPSAKGCGLLLCSDCADLVRKFRSNLEKVVSENKKVEGENGVRADAVYLLPGNDLWKFYTGSD